MSGETRQNAGARRATSIRGTPRSRRIYVCRLIPRCLVACVSRTLAVSQIGVPRVVMAGRDVVFRVRCDAKCSQEQELTGRVGVAGPSRSCRGKSELLG